MLYDGFPLGTIPRSDSHIPSSILVPCMEETKSNLWQNSEGGTQCVDVCVRQASCVRCSTKALAENMVALFGYTLESSSVEYRT